MGASGSAWIKPKKRSGLRADRVTNVPHPRFVRAGQRYFPLASRAANVVTAKVVRVTGDRCELKCEDTSARTLRVRTERLLAVTEDARGRYYRFIGYARRAAYPTHAVVVDVGRDWTRLIVPEWHPDLSVAVATTALPHDARGMGTWLSCRADLSADAAARVQPVALAPAGPRFDPEVHHPVQLERAAGDPPAAPPGAGEGRDDVVLFLPAERIADATAGSAGVYVTGHPPPTRPGSRAYLHADGVVMGWREVRAVRPLPSGTRIVLGGPWHATTIDAKLAAPSSAVVGGRHDQQQWASCSWPRGD